VPASRRPAIRHGLRTAFRFGHWKPPAISAQPIYEAEFGARLQFDGEVSPDDVKFWFFGAMKPV
jgi:hypothetical protein